VLCRNAECMQNVISLLLDMLNGIMASVVMTIVVAQLPRTIRLERFAKFG
jgi:hypothetical protein